MVTFDSRADGTAAEVWRGDPRLGAAPALDLAGIRRLVVVAAHPDDETLGAGGLIASCASVGIEVTVVVVTDGAASHPESATHDRQRLASIRSGEVSAAIAALAPDARLVELGFADGETRESRAEITFRLSEILAELLADVTLVVAPWRGDGHRDHRIVGEVCAELTRKLGLMFVEYPIWLWHWAVPSEAREPSEGREPSDGHVPWTRFRSHELTPPAREAKAAAILAFESQLRPLSDDPRDGVMLGARFLEHFSAPIEFFIVERVTLGGDYFDALYDRHDDPWGFATRWYERRKRTVTMAVLPEERYGSALEIGCSLGLLTLDLAGRIDRLFAVDISETAVARARERVAGHPNVVVEQRDVAESYPAGQFDLIVLSEVGYYLDRKALEVLLDAMMASLAPGGTVLLCHWRHPVVDYPLSGDEVHAAVGMRPELTTISHHEEKDFLLDVYSRDPRSVAERTGLA